MDHDVDQDWEDRVTAAWAAFDDYPEERAAEFRALIDALVAELPDGSPLRPFERACAWDSTGHSDRAAPLYREAFSGGLGDLSGYKGRRAKIQLSSSLRNIGQAEEGVKLLTPELDGPSDELDDAVRACLAPVSVQPRPRPRGPLPRAGRPRSPSAALPAVDGALRTRAGRARGLSRPCGGDQLTLRSFC